MILNLWTRYTILIHRDWQLSGRFYVFEWDTSFIHRDSQVSRWFYQIYVLNKISNFHLVDIYIFQVPYKETNSTNWHSMLSLVRKKKIIKNWLATKFCDGDNMYRYRLSKYNKPHIDTWNNTIQHRTAQHSATYHALMPAQHNRKHYNSC